MYRLFLLLAATLLLVGCAKQESQGRTKLVLGDQVGLSRAKMEAAGALKGAPFDHEWAQFPGAAPLFEALAAGSVDTAPAGDTPVIAAAAGNAPVRIIAATRSSGHGVAILVPSNSSIMRVADLRGRQVVVSTARGSVAQYLLLGALREAKIDPADVKVAFMPPGEAAAAFDSGHVEAWATFGTYQATAEARGARVLRDGKGINASLGFITASAKALADPAKRVAIVEYIRRQRAANLWSRTHTEAYTQVFARVTRVSPVVAKTVVERENPALVAPDETIARELQVVADRFFAESVLPQKVDVTPLFDPSIFADADRLPPYTLEH